MAKVGIISLFSNVNHGNKLQNLAMILTLKKLGIDEVYTIYDSKKTNFILKLKLFIKHHAFFARFNKIANINKSLNLIDYNTVAKDYFDYIIVGSDQVWNYTFINEYDNKLCFAKDFIAHKISYAASIGKNRIEEKYIEDFTTGLKDFDHISVREEQAKLALSNIGIKQVQVVLDPTLLIGRDEWDSFVKKPKNIKNKKYIFLYFLGKISNNLRNRIISYAESNYLEIVDILNPKSKYYKIDVNEFLYLVKNAELVLTDSFHSCVFSFIFNKPFIFCDKNSSERMEMSSRTDQLFKTFYLEDRKYKNDNISNYLVHDYSNGYKKLVREQEASKEYLINSLNL